MISIVVKAFIDKNTGVGYNPGNTFESDDLERVSFLTEEGYLHAPEVSEPNEPTLKELKEKAKQLGLEGYSKLNKEELIQLIESAEKVGEDDAGKD